MLLSKDEKHQVREALEFSEIQCSSYLGAILDNRRWADIFYNSASHDDVFVTTVIKDIELWMSLFPKGNGIPNPSAYAARLYEFLCEDNGLSHLGVKMILDKTLQSKRQVPSISEIAAELEPIKEKYQEFKKSYKEFMHLYRSAEQKFIKRLDDEGISGSLSDILDFRQLIKAWHVLFPYDPFPGCDIWAHPFRPDKTADLVIYALSKPRHENPLLMVFLVIVEIAKKDKIVQYNMGDIYREMARLHPDVPSMSGDPNAFYLPSQWKCLNLDAIKPDDGHDTGLFNNDDLIPGLVDSASPQTEIMNYIRKITYDYFSLDQMFE